MWIHAFNQGHHQSHELSAGLLNLRAGVEFVDYIAGLVPWMKTQQNSCGMIWKYSRDIMRNTNQNTWRKVSLPFESMEPKASSKTILSHVCDQTPPPGGWQPPVGSGSHYPKQKSRDPPGRGEVKESPPRNSGGRQGQIKDFGLHQILALGRPHSFLGVFRLKNQ